jgi:putative lipoprotein
MKKIFIALILSSGVLTSCEDFFDINNYSGIPSDGFVNSVENAQSVVNGAYSGLYGLELWRAEIYYYLDFATNELEYRHTDGNLIQLTNFGYTADQAWIKNYWRCLYRLIARANDACSKIWEMKQDTKIMSTLSETDKIKINQMIGECNFLRALGYYYLVRSFGDKLPSHPNYDPQGMGIPIVDSLLTEKDQLMIGRSSLKESWDKVIRDFKTAYNFLPSSWDNSKLGAATKGAAAGYLGQIYMYFGMNDPQAFNDAKYWFDECMKAGNYKLTEDYAWNFDIDHENNSESIFEVQFDISNNDEISSYTWRRLGPEPKSWGVVNVSQEYVDKFSDGYRLDQDVYDDIKNNPKKYISLTNPSKVLALLIEYAYEAHIGETVKTKDEFINLYSGNWELLADQITQELSIPRFDVKQDDPNWGTENSKYLKIILQNSEQGTDPRIYDSFYIPNVDMISNYWDGHDPYLYTTNYYGFKKYIPYNSVESWAGQGLPGFEGNNSINQRIFRLAELYLLYSEICYRQGNTIEAENYLNKVRRRAWGENIDSTTPQEHDYKPSEGDFITILVKEREKEMCLEGTLLFDYMRLGLDKTLFISRGYDPNKHHRLPIPLAERQIVGMDILKQNDGY